MYMKLDKAVGKRLVWNIELGKFEMKLEGMKLEILAEIGKFLTA